VRTKKGQSENRTPTTAKAAEVAAPRKLKADISKKFSRVFWRQVSSHNLCVGPHSSLTPRRGGMGRRSVRLGRERTRRNRAGRCHRRTSNALVLTSRTGCGPRTPTSAGDRAEGVSEVERPGDRSHLRREPPPAGRSAFNPTGRNAHFRNPPRRRRPLGLSGEAGFHLVHLAASLC
jgi:hypothetical protein